MVIKGPIGQCKILLRNMRFFTGRGHAEAINCMCVGTSLQSGKFVSSADQVVVTGSSDGTAVVWQLNKDLDVFRLKYVLRPHGPKGDTPYHSNDINDVACYIINFDAAGVGVCLIWYLRYEDDTTGLEAGENVDDMSGCFSFSNAITVTRN